MIIILTEKKYDEANFKIEDALHARFSFQLYLSQIANYLGDETVKHEFSRFEPLAKACLNALEVIKRTQQYSHPVENAFCRSNIVGVPIDIQIRNVKFMALNESIEFLRQMFDNMLNAYTLREFEDFSELLNKWDLVNQRDNSFFVSTHLALCALDPSTKDYFGYLPYKEIVKKNLGFYQYNFESDLTANKKDKQEAIDDLTTYLDFNTSIQQLLSSMASSRPHLYNFLEKCIDFVYFVHLGVRCLLTSRLNSTTTIRTQGPGL